MNECQDTPTEKPGIWLGKGGALIDRIKWCQDIIFSDCSRIEVHIMCKEYSNTLRKRGMNV